MKTALIAAAFVVAGTPALAQIQDLTEQPLPPAAAAGTSFAASFPQLQSGPGVNTNRAQNAWTQAGRGAGVLSTPFDPEDTVKADIRARMTTTIILPGSEAISDYSLGDKTNFAVRKVQGHPNQLWVWPINPGYDTNLNIVGKSGAVYSVYLRGLPADPDLTILTKQVVRISGGDPLFHEASAPATAAAMAAPANSADEQKSVAQLAANFPDLAPEWLQKGCTFDPTKILHDREMRGDGAIGPRYVYRDKCFTFLDWGEDFKSKSKPGLWKVEDSIDKPLNFDVSRDYRYWIVFTTAPITLRTGDRTLCIKPTKD